MSFYQLGCCLFDSLFSQVQQVWSVRVALADVRDASAGEAVIVCTTSTQRVQGVVTVRWRLVNAATGNAKWSQAQAALSFVINKLAEIQK